MTDIIKKIQKHSDYLPFMLIALLFIAEAELENHALHVSCQLVMTVVTFFAFFFLLFYFKCNKTTALLVSGLLWIILIYIKNKVVIR